MIKFNPQPLEQLKARFHEAISTLYNQIEVKEGNQPLPSKRPENVFDFGDGVRLIISREETPEGNQVIHISGSICKEDGRLILDEILIQHIVEHFALVSDIKDPLSLINITTAQVVHLYLEDKMALPKGSKVH